MQTALRHVSVDTLQHYHQAGSAPNRGIEQESYIQGSPEVNLGEMLYV